MLIEAQQNLYGKVLPFGSGGLQTEAPVAVAGQSVRLVVDVPGKGAATTRPRVSVQPVTVPCEFVFVVTKFPFAS